jgi:riboflavin synthase
VFTGLIEETGEITGVTDGVGGRRLRVRAARVGPALAPGASIAVNGACQTVTAVSRPTEFEVTAVGETLRRTTLGSFRPGHRVNLERPLRVGDRLDGHWVNGHVEGRGRILGVRRDRRDFGFFIGLPAGLERFVVEKGSIAVDGVSLTVGEVEAASFWVHIIPETRERTLFGTYREGSEVNIEADILAKYAAIALTGGAVLAGSAGLAGSATAPGREGVAGGRATAGAWGPRAHGILEAWERGEF